MVFELGKTFWDQHYGLTFHMIFSNLFLRLVK
jgi:hypothetical protein